MRRAPDICGSCAASGRGRYVACFSRPAAAWSMPALSVTQRVQSKERVNDAVVRPGPPRVQIQTQSGCNGHCVFCPNDAVHAAGLPQGRMSEALFQRIIDHLAAPPPRRVSLYLMNEPLLDARLPEFVRYVKERIPATTTLVTTNGTKLSEGKAAALIDAGLARLKVSLQSLDPVKNEQVMGYSSEQVIENILGVKRVMKEKRVRDFDFRVSMVVTRENRDEIAEARRFWRRHGIRLVTSALENRGGNIANAPDMNPDEMQKRANCIRPSREMCILFNGDVVLCCVDWFRTVVVGNVGRQSVHEVWNGLPLRQIRVALREGDAAHLPQICINCTESACPNSHRSMLSTLVRRFLPLPSRTRGK